jgi:anti-sigma factor RsiW
MINSDSLLVAYVDGELDPEATQKVEALLATDPHASQTIEMFRVTAALVRDACFDCLHPEKSPVLSLPYRRRLRQQRRGWAIAASLVAAMVGFGGGVTWADRPPSERAELIDEVASYHQLYSRETEHLVEVTADKIDNLTEWLGKRLGRTLEVPDLATAGLHFAGGRLLVVNNSPVAELMYTRNHGLPIGICVTQMAGGDSPITIEQRGQERLASWVTGGYAYVVVGEIEDSTARDIARRVATQVKSL